MERFGLLQLWLFHTPFTGVPSDQRVMIRWI